MSLNNVTLVVVGLDSDVIYPQGMSCTMPEEFQVALMRSIPGLENCKLVRAGLC